MQSKKVENINVWDEQWELGTLNTSTGGKISSDSQIRCKEYIEVQGDTRYYFYNGSGKAMWMLFFDSNYDVIDNYGNPDNLRRSTNAYGLNNKEFTTPQNCKFIKFYCVASYGATYKNDISLNYPATDHEYHKHV